MGMPVVTVASGGLAVVDNTSATYKSGIAVTEAANGFGRAVTKVASGGMPVMYTAATLQTTGGPPTLVTAVVSVPAAVSVVTLTFTAALDPASVPAPADFLVIYNFIGRSPVSVAVSGSTCVLSFDANYGTPTTATVSYTPGANPLKAASGGALVAAFSNFPITV